MNMAGRRLRRALGIAFAALFVCTQVIALAHASAYGSDAHHHDGTSCQIQMLTAQGVGVAADAPAGADVPICAAPPDFNATSLFRGEPLAGCEPIRGPPPPFPEM